MFHHKVQNIKEHFGKHFNNRGGYDIDVNWSQFSLDGHREEKQREILGTYMKSFTTNRRHKRNCKYEINLTFNVLPILLQTYGTISKSI